MSTTIDATSASSSVTRTLEELQATRTPSNELGQDAFLQILVAQMSHQNPMEPSSDTEYISQLAQFSVLEQMSALNATFQTSQAYALVGKTVYVSRETDASSESEVVVGKVDGVVREGGVDYLVVNDERYETTDVVGVLDDAAVGSTEQQILQSASLIGKNVTASLLDEEGEAYSVSGTVEKIIISQGEVMAVVDGENVPLIAIEEISETATEAADAANKNQDSQIV